jgi:hypothetical protein
MKEARAGLLNGGLQNVPGKIAKIMLGGDEQAVEAGLRHLQARVLGTGFELRLGEAKIRRRDRSCWHRTLADINLLSDNMIGELRGVNSCLGRGGEFDA